MIAPMRTDVSMHFAPAPASRPAVPLLALALLVAALASPAGAAPVPVGPAIPIAAPAEAAAVAVLADGGFAVAWREHEEPFAGSVWLQLFAADDRPLGPPRPVGGDRASRFFGLDGPAIGAAADGSFVVAWLGPGANVTSTAQVRRFAPDGLPVGPPMRVSGGLEALDVELAVAADGGFVVAWTTLIDGRDPDVYARRFAASGSPVGPRFLLHGDTFNDQYLGGIALAPDGRLLAVVESWEGEGNFLDVHLSSFAADDTPLALDVRVNTDASFSNASQSESSIVRLADGRWLVLFNSPLSHADGSVSRTLYGRLLDPDGEPLGPEEVIASGVGGRQSAPVAAPTEDGGFVVLWRDECEWEFGTFEVCEDPAAHRDGHFDGIYGRAFDAAGEPLGDDFLVPVETFGPQTAPAIAAGPAGDLVAAWTSAPVRGDATLRSVLARRLAAPCPPGASTLCLGGGRFAVEAHWRDPFGNAGPGVAEPRDDLWGTFWFFDPENLELAVKLIDGTEVNGHWWVFSASLTNVDYALRVTDTATGRVALYENPQGTFASRGDTAAFEEVVEPAAAAGATRAAAAPRRAARPAEAGACQPAPERLCLLDGRFAVEIDWQDASSGTAGQGLRLPLTDDTGAFWFFRDDNPEVVVKVLDARTVNGRFWVFFASLTDVAFTLEVTDTESGETATYENPDGTLASRGDTDAFPRPAGAGGAP
jgi:hypothetical protein